MNPSLTILRDKAIEAVIESMENLAFIEVGPAESDMNYEQTVNWLDLDWYYMTIFIYSPFAGEMRLIVPGPVVTVMAKNMWLLEENEISAQLKEDLLKEVLNVIAGRILIEIVPPNETFQLGIPDAGRDSFLKLQTASIAIDFKMKGLPFWLVLVGDQLLGWKK